MIVYTTVPMRAARNAVVIPSVSPNAAEFHYAGLYLLVPDAGKNESAPDYQPLLLSWFTVVMLFFCQGFLLCLPHNLVLVFGRGVDRIQSEVFYC
jgi:hypothetical protein